MLEVSSVRKCFHQNIVSVDLCSVLTLLLAVYYFNRLKAEPVAFYFPALYYRQNVSALRYLFMVALWNRSPYGIGQTIYIFMLWFVLSSSSSFFPRLISAAADWMSAILPHMVWP